MYYYALRIFIGIISSTKSPQTARIASCGAFQQFEFEALKRSH
jgi:hypothetical protein